MKDGGVLGDGDPASRGIEGVQVDIGGTALRVVQLRPADREVSPELDQPEDPPLGRRNVIARRVGDLLDPAQVGRRVIPAMGAGEVDQLAGGEGRREPLARLLIEESPACLRDRRVLSEEVAQLMPPRRLPMPSDSLPASGRALGGLPFGRFLLRLLAVLDDVAVLEEDPLRDLAPQRKAAKEKLEVHGEVLELLTFGVPHDRPGRGVALDGEALFVPVDGLRLLDQVCGHSREGPRFLRKFRRGLVVLVESHVSILSEPGVIFAPAWLRPVTVRPTLGTQPSGDCSR